MAAGWDRGGQLISGLADVLKFESVEELVWCLALDSMLFGMEARGEIADYSICGPRDYGEPLRVVVTTLSPVGFRLATIQAGNVFQG